MDPRVKKHSGIEAACTVCDGPNPKACDLCLVLTGLSNGGLGSAKDAVHGRLTRKSPLFVPLCLTPPLQEVSSWTKGTC